ncbi:MAG: hypothetical protein GY802_08790 [Gammaproteobacteria bacterium]|nr:hypothetical protein [Gammaproteobacteria bacterium]
MKFGDVLYQSHERMATITLNRPESYNAISESMPDDIADAIAHADSDDRCTSSCLPAPARAFAVVSERDSGDPIAGSKI